jgi:hypothetical protein
MTLTTYRKYRALRAKIKREGGDQRAAMRAGA